MTSAESINFECLDISKLCRTCGKPQKDTRAIFENCLDRMLVDICLVEVKRDDGLPQHLCLPCVLQLSRSFTFQKRAQQIDFMVRSYIQEANQKAAEASKTITDDYIILIADQALPAENSSTCFELQSLQDISLPSEIVPAFECAQRPQSDDICDLSTHQINLNEEEMAHLEPIQNQMVETQNTIVEAPPIQNYVVQQQEQPLLEVEPVNLQCSNCSHILENQELFQIHIQKCIPPSDNLVVCKTCGKSFKEQKILNRHMKTHKPHSFHCNECGASFAERSNMTKHLKKHTGELRNVEGKPLSCRYCGRQYKWASSLAKHLKYHTKSNLLYCSFCPKFYVEAKALTLHLRSHTGEKPFACRYCSKSFSQQCNLDKHERCHTGDRPFQCKYCFKSFTQGGYLNVHLRIHRNEKRHKCGDCGRGFVSSNTLAAHKLTHTKEKRFQCQFENCLKRFARQETLRIHQTTHTKLKPHQCSSCSKSFPTARHLKAHVNDRHVPRRCDVCFISLANANALKLHMRTQHEIVREVVRIEPGGSF